MMKTKTCIYCLLLCVFALWGCKDKKQDDSTCAESQAIDINDTALLKSIIDSAYASDTIDWPADFNGLDTTELVFFASIREHIPSLHPDSMTKTFGACVDNDCICFGETPWYESTEDRGVDIEADLVDVHFHIDYDKLIPILSRIDGKLEVSRKIWSFDHNRFIVMYYLPSDTTLIPIDGIIIHKEHPVWYFE